MKPFDEMYARLPGGQGSADVGQLRAHYETYQGWLSKQTQEQMKVRRAEAEMVFRRVGITFAVYGEKDAEGDGTERLIPFDLIPRIIPSHEWHSLEKGLVQRVQALNRFMFTMTKRS